MTALAETLIRYLGGAQNIVAVTHCAVRVRFTLTDLDSVNDDAITALDEVVLVMRQFGQVHVVPRSGPRLLCLAIRSELTQGDV